MSTNLSLQKKLLLSYLFLAVLPVIVLGIYLSTSIKEITINRAISEAIHNVEMIKTEYNRSLNEAVNLSNQLYLNKNFFNLVNKNYKSTWDAVETYFSFNEFEDLRKIYINSIENIRVFVNNETILENWYLNKIDAKVIDTDWYQTAKDNPAKIVWSTTYNDKAYYTNKDCFGIVRWVASNNQITILLIDINRSYINSLLQKEYFDTVITNSSGVIICAKDKDKIGTIYDDYTFDDHDYDNKVIVIDHEDDQGSIKIIISDLVVEGINGKFRIASSFQLKDILNEADQVFFQCMVIVVVCLIVVGILTMWFSKVFSRRVIVLSKEMEQVSKGNFDLQSELRGNDEIGILSQSLNVMAKNLKQLIQENHEAKIQKQSLLLKHKDIQLKVLKNQINPHFLFNTLESLRMESHIRNEKDISNIIQKLGGLLYNNLHAGQEEISLIEEMKLVEDYLSIQAFRFGSKINYSLDISEDSKNVKILPFMIQPVVENAITHGIEDNEDPGIINIKTSCINHDLLIEVYDNGTGISEKKLHEIRESLNEDETSLLHIGIRNVHLRSKIHYGEDYGLSIESEEHVYTKVSIRIPIRGEL